MKWTEEEKAFFGRFGKSGDGNTFLGYLERVRLELSDLETMKPDDFSSRREALILIKNYIVNPLKFGSSKKEVESNNDGDEKLNEYV